VRDAGGPDAQKEKRPRLGGSTLILDLILGHQGKHAAARNARALHFIFNFFRIFIV
jgi:hypothetical protein